jgi:hypothetical protein
MLKLGLGIEVTKKRITAGTSFDPDAQAFFNRVTAAGGSLTATEQNATNTLVLDLKGFGVWSVCNAIYPMVGASAAACAQNLKSASYTATFSSGWTFAITGITPVVAYMNTTYNQTINGDSVNSAHLSFYSRTNNTLNNVDIGVEQPANNYNLLQFNTAGLSYVAINTTGFATYMDSNSLGFYVGNRQASNDQDLWKNGTKVINATTTSFSLPNDVIYIGAYNRFGLPAAYSARESAFASIGSKLTDTEAANYYTAVQTFQTTLSRQV